MARDIRLALDQSDRTLALHLGIVDLPDGVRLHYVPQAGAGRHERMFRDREWDLCEFSLASYIVARSRGYPLRAISVFPRRMFTQSLIYVRRGAGIASPSDLEGKRFGIRTFQTTLCVWGIGDLATVHGVDLRAIEWLVEDEGIVPSAPPASLRWQGLGGGSIDRALEEGEVDALIVPRIPAPALAGGPVDLLFPDPFGEMRGYYATTGVFPIMHAVVGWEEVFRERPGLARELTEAFERAKQTGYGFYADPNWSLLAGSRQLLEDQRSWLGEDPYPYGLEANRPALERLIRYEVMLGLIREPIRVDDLFEVNARG